MALYIVCVLGYWVDKTRIEPVDFVMWEFEC